MRFVLYANLLFFFLNTQDLLASESLNCIISVKGDSKNQNIKINYPEINETNGFQNLSIHDGRLEIKANKVLSNRTLKVSYKFTTKKETSNSELVIEPGASIEKVHKAALLRKRPFFKCNYSQDSNLTPEEEDKILSSVKINDFLPLKKYLLTGGSLFTRISDDLGDNFLTRALRQNNPEFENFILSLLEKERSHEVEVINQKNYYDRTSLIVAIKNGRIEASKRIINLGANLYLSNAAGENPLTSAIAVGSTELIEFMRKKGMDLKTASNMLPVSGVMAAAKEDNLKMIKYLVDNGAKWNLSSESGNNAFFIAAGNGNLEILEYLHNKGGIDVNSGEEGKTPLMVAAENNNLEVINLLINLGANIDTESPQGATALYIATIKFRTEAVLELIKRGAKNFEGGESGWTPLLAAANSGQLTILRNLIDAGANLDFQLNTGETPLYVAAYQGHTEIVDYLLKSGVKNFYEGPKGWSPLNVAVNQNHSSILKLLVKFGADINYRESSGKTPLYEAVVSQRPEQIRNAALLGATDIYSGYNDYSPLQAAVVKKNREILIELTRRFTYTSKDYAEAQQYTDEKEILELLRFHESFMKKIEESEINEFFRAVISGDDKKVEEYLKKGVNPDLKDDDRTALYGASLYNQVNAAKLILEIGRPLELIDGYEDWTTIHVAAMENASEIINLLVQYGVGVDTLNTENQTPLQIAAKYGSLEAIKALIKNKADIYFGNINPFYQAILAYNTHGTEAIKYLSQYFPKTFKNDKGLTPLSIANYVDKEELLETLYKMGYQDVVSHQNDYSNLTIAANFGYLNSLRFFSKFQNIDSPDAAGDIPIIVAVKKNQKKAVKLLFDLGSTQIERAFQVSQSNENQELASYIQGLRFKDFFKAIETGDLPTLQNLISNENINILTTFDDYRFVSPLSYSIINNQTEVTKYLLQAGSDINLGNEQGSSPITFAVKFKNHEILRDLIQAGAKLPTSETSILFNLVESWDSFSKEIFDLLRKLPGSNLSAKNEQGKTIADIALEKGYTKAFREFLELNLYGNDLLERLLEVRHDSLLLVYIEKNPQEIKERFYQCRSFGCPEKNETVFTAAMLYLFHDKDLNSYWENYENMVMYIIREGRPKWAAAILPEGFDGVHHKDHNGNTSLHFAVMRGEIEIIKVLHFTLKVDLNVTNKIGRTPLHFAALTKNLEILRYLLANGADLNAKDTQGKTPLDLAKLYPGREEVVQFLKSRGAQ